MIPRQGNKPNRLKRSFVVALRRQGYRFHEIGKRLGLSVERCRQLEAGGLRNERESFNTAALDLDSIERQIIWRKIHGK